MADDNKPSVGILTTFYEFNPSYSLTSVVESQLRALVRNDYRTVLYVHDNFKDDDKIPQGVEIKKIVPRFLLVDYANFQAPLDDLDDQAEKAYQAFKEHLDTDIIIEHDLIFQGWFQPYCMAIHKLAKESDIRWLHWIHSVPTPRDDVKPPHDLRFKLPPNSKLIYLNNTDVVRVAETYNTFPKDVRVVHNPLDPRIFWDTHPIVDELIDKYDILSADFMQIYPVSTPRMVEGKQIKAVIHILAKLKKIGKTVRLVVCNAHANDKREKQTIAEVLSFANEKGLSSAEVIFTSLQSPPTYEHGVPRSAVSQLFQLSNLFIFPSISENCSLILLEAMLSGNLLVLNKSLQSLREFGKHEALYFDFGSTQQDVHIDNREQYMRDIARIIISEFGQNKALKAQNNAKQYHNYDVIFKNSIEPLFYEK